MKGKSLVWMLITILLVTMVWGVTTVDPFEDLPEQDSGEFTVEDAIAQGQIPDEMYEDPQLYTKAGAYDLIDPDKFDMDAYREAVGSSHVAINPGDSDLMYGPGGIQHPNGDTLLLPGNPPLPVGSVITSTEDGLVLTFDKGEIGEKKFEDGYVFQFDIPKDHSITIDTQGSTIKLADGNEIKGNFRVDGGDIIIPEGTGGDSVYINEHEIITSDEAVVVVMDEPPYFEAHNRVAVDRMKLFNQGDTVLTVYLDEKPQRSNLPENYIAFSEYSVEASAEEIVVHPRPGNNYFEMTDDNQIAISVRDASFRISAPVNEEPLVSVGVDGQSDDSMLFMKNGNEVIHYNVGGDKGHYSIDGDYDTVPMKLDMYALNEFDTFEPIFEDGASELLFAENSISVVPSENHVYAERVRYPTIESPVTLRTSPRDQVRMMGVDIVWDPSVSNEQAEIVYDAMRYAAADGLQVNKIHEVLVLDDASYYDTIRELELAFDIVPTEGEQEGIDAFYRIYGDDVANNFGITGSNVRKLYSAPYYILGGRIIYNKDRLTYESADKSFERFQKIYPELMREQ